MRTFILGLGIICSFFSILAVSGVQTMSSSKYELNNSIKDEMHTVLGKAELMKNFKMVVVRY